VQVGDPILEGWAIYRRFWEHLVLIALFTYVVVSVISLVLALAGGFLGELGGIVVSIAGVFLLQGALVEAVADVRDGRADLTLFATLGRVWPLIGKIVAASLLAGLVIAIGFLLIIFPGLYLVTIFSVVVPVIVLERTGVFEAFSRSRALVRGYGWTVFGVILVTFVLNLIASLVLTSLLHGLSNVAAQYISSVVVNTLLAPFVAATWTSMYFRLKELHAPATTPAFET
jgi:hypothetical protein